MRDVEVRRLDKYEREMAFAVENAADFPVNSPGGKIIKLMRGDIVLVKDFAAGQTGGAGERAQHTETKQGDLEELKELMRLLDYAADVLADDFPGIENLFGIPRNRGEQSILAAARSQYELSEQYEAAMIEKELPETFRADMNRLITRIEQASESADRAGERGSGSTSGIKAAMSRLAANSKKLDALCRIKYRGNPPKMGEWERASHLERPPQKPKKVE